MNLHSKLVLGVAAIALVGGLGATAMAADPAMPAPAAGPMAPAPTPLTDVQKPKDALVGTKVKDNKGDAVGEVRAVKLGPDGKIASVDVNLGSKIVALKADSLTYAEGDKTLTSKQSKLEIQSLNSM